MDVLMSLLTTEFWFREICSLGGAASTRRRNVKAPQWATASRPSQGPARLSTFMPMKMCLFGDGNANSGIHSEHLFRSRTFSKNCVAKMTMWPRGKRQSKQPVV